MDRFLNQISELIALDPETTSKIFISIAILLGIGLIRFIVLRIVYRQTKDVRIRYNWRKSITYIAVTLGILILGRVWFAGFQSLATYLGLLSAGIAIALRDPLVNLAAWAFIMWRRPFTVGDRIEIGGYGGDVIDLRIFQFTLMEIGLVLINQLAVLLEFRMEKCLQKCWPIIAKDFNSFGMKFRS
jgi:small-conductance mechanosensitive channel